MDFGAVNWLAVLVAGIVSMGIGAAWYTTLGKQWMAALGKTRDQLGNDRTPFIFAFVMELVMAYVLALVIPGLLGSTNVGNGIVAGLLMWVGFVITTMILNHRYQGAPWNLTMIDGAHLLIVMVAQGIVIGLFG